MLWSALLNKARINQYFLIIYYWLSNLPFKPPHLSKLLLCKLWKISRVDESQFWKFGRIEHSSSLDYCIFTSKIGECCRAGINFELLGAFWGLAAGYRIWVAYFSACIGAEEFAFGLVSDPSISVGAEPSEVLGGEMEGEGCVREEEEGY